MKFKDDWRPEGCCLHLQLTIKAANNFMNRSRGGKTHIMCVNVVVCDCARAVETLYSGWGFVQ